MDKNRVRKMAIISDAECWDGTGERTGKTIFEVLLIVTNGPDFGDVLISQYMFEGDLPDYLRRMLLKLGCVVNTAEGLKRIAAELTGIVVKVSLVMDGDISHVYIDDYFGRDDPEKYKTDVR